MTKEDLRTLSLALSLVDVGKIFPFSCLTLLLHLKQGNVGFYWHLSILFEETFLLKELSTAGPWDSLFALIRVWLL